MFPVFEVNVNNLLHVSNVFDSIFSEIWLCFWELCRLLHDTYSPSLFLIMLNFWVNISDKEQPCTVNFM